MPQLENRDAEEEVLDEDNGEGQENRHVDSARFFLQSELAVERLELGQETRSDLAVGEVRIQVVPGQEERHHYDEGD